MAFPLRSHRAVALLLIVAGIAGAGVGAYFLLGRKPPSAGLPEPDSPTYQEYVEAFQVGVAGLDAGEYNIGLDRLNRAIELIPDEPAAWANRGLLRLRQNELKEAAADLQRAQELAPDSSEVESLLGQLAKKNGRFAEAADHFRKAVARDPHDAMTRYALANALATEGGPDSDAEYQHQIQEIFRAQPTNLFVLTELAGAAARRSDAAALREVLNRLERLSPSWSPATRERLKDLGRAAAGPLPGDVPPALTRFDIILRSEPGYARGKDALEGRHGLIGTSVQHFLHVQPLRATPAPPDLEITFTAEALPGLAAGGSRWDAVSAVWLTDSPNPIVLVANGREVRQVGKNAPALAFPGGPRAVAPSAHGVLALDWNNDYRTDLLLAGTAGLRFHQQRDDGRFIEVTGKTGLGKDILQADYFGAWTADIDMDGDLDIIVAPRDGAPFVLRNNRDGTFTALRPFSGVDGARGFVWADLDNDGAPDAAFIDAEGRVHVYFNERLSQFRKREMPVIGLGKALALAAADGNDNGTLDLLVLQAAGGVVRISDSDKGKSWTVSSPANGPDFAGDATPGTVTFLAADLDNNGGLDLVASTPQETRVWLSDAEGKFRALPSLLPHVAAAVDLTGDGRLDLLALSAAGQPVRRVNRGTKAYHWQAVRFLANRKDKDQVKADDRINSFAIGSEVEVRTGAVIQKQTVTAPLVHFGLGERRGADVIRIVWPNGIFQAEFEQPGDTVVAAEQRLGASCPFLFTDDGTDMQFVTDFMWGAPLGVVIDGQDTTTSLQTISWVKVRGDQLVPRDGYYNVRVLANLWETHFYDHMALRVVDHPPGTEIHVDERAADSPLVPEVIVTGPSHPIARARDQDGRDVTDVVRANDGRYLDGFRLGQFRGVAADHWVEAYLGDDAPADGPVWLLARGWVYPPSSTIYAALAQGKHDQPQGLVLEVPDGKGGWKVGRPALGCPAGKNKTILVRLDGIVGKGVSRRFRLRTNMEIYWDSLTYACSLPVGRIGNPSDLHGRIANPSYQQVLLPDAAELRYHGTVEMTQANDSSPELPHYNQIVRVEQDWRDLIGYHTRYGDVRELLATVDDRYVITTAGDEIALRFRAPADPPAGWRRDFVWMCDGWAKDGDLNTRFSKTVLPLPAHDLKSYDRPPGRLEDDPVYRRFPRDWEVYHTRYVTPRIFEQGLRSFRRPQP